MTAEIIVLNKEGIALATDSAVTSSLGDIDKILPSANKLFALSTHHPIGIMVYGNSLFMDVPWETIIKLYRSTSLRSSGFSTLEEYAKDFLSFLSYKNIMFHDTSERHYLGELTNELFRSIRNRILKQIGKETNADKGLDQKDVIRITWDLINITYDFIHDLDSSYIPVEYCKTLVRKYNRDVQDIIEINFGDLPLSKDGRALLKKIVIEVLSKSIQNNISSGIVIAGFGEKEVLPSVRAFRIEGIILAEKNNEILEILKYTEDKDKSSYSHSAAVIPYAQEDMVCRFMEGVDPDYVEAQDEFLAGLFRDYAYKVVSQLTKYSDLEKRKILQKMLGYGKRMTNEFSKNMNDFTKERFTDPTVEAVERLNKNELAAMAEALVYVTSLKRKISSDSETVSEPIDVAVISKGDGFIWIKRKHYFDPKLNPQYFMRRYKEVTYEGHQSQEKSDSSAE